MDFNDIIEHHIEKRADITVATIPVRRDQVPGFGIMQTDADQRITRFVEKPADRAVQDSLRLDPAWYGQLKIKGEGEFFLASMGIYVFSREVIFKLLENELIDFGKHIIPQAIKDQRVYSFIFQGYWEDIGTIRAFFEANLDVTNELPRFNFFDMSAPIFSRPRFLPGSKINGAQIDHAVISDGCIINRATIAHSIVGLRCVVEAGTVLNRTVLLGSDYYESEESIKQHREAGEPPIGIGSNCRIENTIVDKNARIGNNLVISPVGKPEKVDGPNYFIRDGIVIIPKNGTVPHGTVI
jgi:glucose-1-phosphate adenylyltransferase